ncbi:MAG: AAA family ATPase [Alphaproteobacteria bacterium]|nr:AAA family ATPase [Alphaproteobacteria bacterium]
MATVHFMHGFIGSGKTTIAKRLARELPAVRLNNDDWIVLLYGRGPHGDKHLDYVQRIDKVQWDLAREIVRAGGDVIFDCGTWSKSGRKESVARALEFADKVIFHNIKCDIDVARARCVRRTESGGNELFICADAFDALLSKFEPISDDEGFKVITYDNNSESESGDIEIKEWRYAAYILPVREINGKKQVAFIRYKSGWHGAIGGRQDGDETPREALCREILEELGESAKFITDNAIEVPEKMHAEIRDVSFRRAKNEEHTFFITKIPATTEFVFCEKDNPGFKIVWLDVDALIDEKIVIFKTARDYNARVLIPIIEDL